MSALLPPFLSQLGLQADADERAVRRAYAQRLKQIDQEADPTGFQRLRQAYDSALQWARRPAPMRDADGVDVAPSPSEADQPASDPLVKPGAIADLQVPGPPAVPQPLAPPVPVPKPSAVRLEQPMPEPGPASQGHSPTGGTAPEVSPAPASASAAFVSSLPPLTPVTWGDEAFEACLAALPADVDHPAPALAALRHVLSHPRMINLEARMQLEWRVARQLVQGWRPGHEYLWTAAREIFEWDGDRQRLMRLGGLGQALDAALLERDSFLTQASHHKAEQRMVIDLLRCPELPGDEVLRSRLTAAEQLVSIFPNWLNVIVPVQNLERWRARADALQPEPTDPPPSPDVPAPSATRRAAAPPSGSDSYKSYWWLTFLLCTALLVLPRMCDGLSQESSLVAAPAPKPAGKPQALPDRLPERVLSPPADAPLIVTFPPAPLPLPTAPRRSPNSLPMPPSVTSPGRPSSPPVGTGSRAEGGP